MRSSKSRSRSKSNRPRSVGNNVNRVFDSSGPEGKVRGTPQQIIDKYLMLARDAQLSNDRVAELNFLQHAEHYTRMLSEAMRELAREQENRQSQGGGQQNNGNHQNNGNSQNGGGQSGGGQSGDSQQGSYQGGQSGGHQGGGYSNQRHDRRDNRNDDAPRDTHTSVAIETQDDEGPGLVETPEARREPRRQSRMMPEMPLAPEAAAQPEAAKPPRAPRPRKPRVEKPDAPQGGSEPSATE